jgi:Na+/proline symporter
MYAAKMGIAIPERSDDLYPVLALNHFSPFVGIVFLLGIIAAAFSSADSALTSLTTAFCVDFLDLKKLPEEKQKRKRLLVHIGFSVLVFLIIVGFRVINNDSVITAVFIVAGYTYGPLLGLFAFGMFTKWQVKDALVPYVAISAPILTYLASQYSNIIIPGYNMGFEVLLLNGLLTFIGLMLIRKNK